MATARCAARSGPTPTPTAPASRRSPSRTASASSAFADWVLDVPMYFIMRDGQWIDAAGMSFRAFLEGRAEKLKGYTATMGDWADHVTTVFTDVRLKRFLEMRGADAGSFAALWALPALWVGLLYDQASARRGAGADERSGPCTSGRVCAMRSRVLG